MSLRPAATKGLFWMLLSSTTYFFFSLASSLILPRLLLPVDYGVFASASAFLAYLTFASDWGITPSAIQIRELDKATFSTAFTLKILVATLSFGAVVALSPLVSWYFGNQNVGTASIVLALVVLITAAWFPQDITLSRQLDFRSFFFLGFCSSAASLVIAVWLALNHFMFWSIVLSAVGSAAVTAVLAWGLVKSHPGLGFERHSASSLWQFGKNYSVSTAVDGIITVGVGRFVIGGILGLTGLGFYAIAFALSSFVSTGVSTLDTVFFPVFSRLNVSGASLKEATLLVIEHASWLAFPIVIGLEALGPEVIVLVLGNGTNKWAPSILPLQFLLIGQLLSVIYIPLSAAYKANAQTHFLRTASIASAVTYIPLLYVATVEFQLSGAAIASVYVALAIFTVYVAYARSSLDIGLREIGKVTLKPLVASLAFYPVVVLLDHRVGPSYVGLFGQAAIGLAVYVAIMSLLTRGAFLVRTKAVVRNILQ